MRASSFPARVALSPLAAAARLALAAGLVATPLWLQASTPLPTGLQVVQGQATVATQGALMTVKNSPGAILNWQSFSIAAGAGVHFQQANAASKVLNRVVGRDPSLLLGSLTSNGQVWLLNPNGVLFGQGARVDVAGLVASTLRLPDSDFLSGRYRFSAAAGDAGVVRNEGALQTTFGGQVVLLGSRVENTGSVVAPGGSVALAAGRSVELVDTGLPHLAVKVELPASADAAGGSEVLNLGRLVTDGGRVDLYAGIVNQQGLVQADTLGTDAQGRVTLQAAQQLNLAEGSTTRAAGGTLRLDAGAEGQATVAGLLDTSSAQGRGGDLLLQGRRILLGSTALLDASGASGGGLLRVGGDFQGKNPLVRHADMVTALRGATLRADATGQGDGGLVVVWSDTATRFGGHVSTRGGALGGHGGLAEVSAKGWLDYRGTADLRASAGREGTLLLDPLNIVIQASTPNLNGDGTTGDDLGSNSIAFVDNPAATSVITAAQLAIQLGSSSVTLQATNDITVSDAVNAASPSNLTLQAGNNIDINAALSVGGSLLLSANDNGAGTASGIGRVAVLAPLTSTAGNIALTNGGGTGVHTFAAALTAVNLNVIGDINLSNAATWTLSGAGSSLNSNLTGSGGFTKEGAGTLTLNAPGFSNYSGSTLINAGTLRVTSGSQALGTGFVFVNAGATLDASNGVSIASDLTLAGGRLTSSSGTGTFTGNILLSTAATMSSSGGATLVIDATGNIGGSAGLTVDAGVVRFQGSGNSMGDLLITGGAELAINDGGQLGFGIVTLDNGTLRSVTNPVTISNTVDMGSGGGTLATNTAMEFFDGLGGTGRLTHDGSGGGTLTLQSAATHTGGTTINGVFITTGTGQLPSTGLVTIQPAGVLQLGGSESIGDLTGTGAVNLAAFSLATGQDGGDVAFAGVISGSGSFSKVGSGVATLSGINTYTGGTTVSSGTLRLAGASATAGNSSGGVLVFSTLDVSDGATVANLITSSSGTLANSSGSGRITGAVVMSDGPMSVGSTGTGLTLAGPVSGSVGLNKATSGLVSLTGTNTYAGTTSVTAGTLSVGDGGNTGSLGTGTVNIASGSTLQFNRANAHTVSNTLLGAGNVLQQGTGITTISGSNGHSGDTTVNAGTLRVQGTSGTLGSSFVTVNSGGTLDLVGGVSLNNTLEVAAGGQVGASNGTNGLTGAVALSGGTAAFGLAGGTLQVFNTVSGSGALNVAAGNVALYAPNSHTGGTSVSSGANLALDGSSAAVPGGIAVAGTLNPRNGAVLPNTITLGPGAALGGGGGVPATVSGSVVLGGDANFFVTAGDITISGPISGTGNLTLPFGGAQTLTFSGNNTYVGDTRLTGSNLTVNGGNAIPDNSTVVVASAFTLNVLADETLGGLSGAGTVGHGSNVLRVGANNTSTTYDGAISGVGPFEKLGSGTLTLTGPSSVGGTNILGGVLALQGANATLGGGVISIGSAQLDLLGGASVSNSLNANGGTLRGDGGQVLGNLGLIGDLTLLGGGSGLLVAGVISGSGNVATGGTGTTTFSSAHTYTGSTTVNAGTLVLGAANRLPDAGTLVVNGGVFDLGAGSETVANVQLLAGSIVNGTLTSTGGYDVRSGSVSALLAGTAGLVKSGAGTVTLSAQNSYAGATVLDGGTLVLNNASPLTLSALSLNQGTLAGSGAITVGGALQVLGGSVTLAGSAGFTTSGSTSINLAAASGGTLTVARPWVNNGTLSLAGDDFIALDGSAGGFITNASGGVMNLASTASFVVQNLGGAPAFNNAGTLNYNGAGLATLAAGSFTNLGAVNVSSGGLAVNGGGSDSGSYTVATGALLAFTGGTRSLGAGASATGGGRLEVSAGTVDINTALTPGALLFQTSGGTLNFNHTAAQTVSALTLTGGAVGGTGSLVVSGAFNASGTNASLQGGASFSTLGTGVVNLVTATGGTLAVSRPWVNSGSLSIGGDDAIAFNASAGGQFVNDAAGTVTLNGSAATPLGLSAGTGTLFNSGTLVKLSAGTQTLAFTSVDNSGTLDVGAGTLALAGSLTQTGSIATNTGATLAVPAGFTNAAAATISGLGTVDVGSGTLTQQGTLVPGSVGAAGTLSITGNLVMSGGVLTLDLGGTTPGSSDRLAVSGSTTLGGSLQVATLPAYNPANADAIPVLLSGSSTGVFDSVSQPAGFSTGYRLAAGEAVRLIFSSTPNTRVFTNGAGTLDWSNAANWGGSLPGSADTALISSGFSVLKAGGTDTVAGLEVNAGNALTVSGGSLTVTGAALLGGNLAVQGSGLVVLGGAVSGGGSAAVSNGTLTLNGAAAFAALNLTGGLLDGTGSLDVNGSFTRSGGSSVGSGYSNVTLTQASGALLPGAWTAGSLNFTTLGSGAGDVLQLDGALVASSGGITLTTNRFVNNAGAGALSVPGAARWLVYSADPALDTRSGLVPAFKQYNAPAATPPAAAGNGLLYSLAPTLSATLQGAVNKVYDGSTAATLAAGNFALGGALAGDTVTLTPVTAGLYADRNAGTGKTVLATGLSYTAVDAATGVPVFGYGFSGNASGAVGGITAAPLVLTGLSALNKVYDGNTAAPLAGTASITPLGADAVSLAGTAAGVFADKNAGSAKPVALSGLSLAGADAGNYTLVLPASLLADITPRPLSLTGLLVPDKVYDATPAATLSGTAAFNAVAGDLLTLAGTASASFADKNVGSNKPVTVTGLGLTGADAGNYTLQPVAGVTASITARPLAVAGLTAQNKVYDATAVATLGGTASVTPLPGDVLTLAGTASGSFADANVGVARPVTVAGLSLAGADAANYVLVAPASLQATITPATLSLTADPLTAPAGTPLPPLTGSVSGFVGSDTQASATTGTLSWSSPATLASEAGSYAINGGGLASLNYLFVQAAGNTTALTLTPAPTQPAATNASVTATTLGLQTVQVPLLMSTPSAGRVLDVTPLLASTGTSAAGATTSTPEGGSTPATAAPEASTPATALSATPAAAGEGGGGAPVFRAVNYGLLPRPQVQNLLAAREQYKKQVFAQGLFKLEQDPTLADVRPCKTEAELSTGNCVITEALRQEIQQAITARAVVAGPRKPERRRVRQAALPNIERKLALLIGVNTYRDKRVPALEGAVPDARAVRTLLEGRLGYEATVLENPSREAMIRAFNKIALEADANDSVVIYYAGHGVVVPVGGTDTGFWLPSDTNAEDPASWLSNADIARMVAAVGSRQLMLISDSCYSGSLVGNERVQVTNSSNAADMLTRKAAVVMSSGGNEPVADEGRDGHSVFAWHFMRALEGVDNWQIGGSVFDRVRSAVSKEFPQTPQYGASRSAGHQGNTDFLFERREFEAANPAPSPATPRPAAPR
ncbi:hypothetical protein IP87_09350 [beta proteobacterium AAP121]|nr:hypothetical protein IP80_13090 [beta proteobacterium AAP65]KPF98082.1 hypothetical protein IP87_09350 [beta proteobacterium AAP121]